MSIFNALNTSASALTAQRLRMDVISSNVANAQTTRATTNEDGEFEAYLRKMVAVEPNEKSFIKQKEQIRRFIEKARTFRRKVCSN